MILAVVIRAHEVTVLLAPFPLTKEEECSGPGLWTICFMLAMAQDLQGHFRRFMSKRDGMQTNGIDSACGGI